MGKIKRHQRVNVKERLAEVGVSKTGQKNYHGSKKLKNSQSLDVREDKHTHACMDPISQQTLKLW